MMRRNIDDPYRRIMRQCPFEAVDGHATLIHLDRNDLYAGSPERGDSERVARIFNGNRHVRNGNGLCGKKQRHLAAQRHLRSCDAKDRPRSAAR
ncbi:hypothetical protein [Tsuneonella flava]|uniref:hypothetical protein n=1 Tax=Tsuneonella flava TaxID=2055955 RepID=UPI001E524A22|nr:hypothetical protein [Tsuneonella flava]